MERTILRVQTATTCLAENGASRFVVTGIQYGMSYPGVRRDTAALSSGSSALTRGQRMAATRKAVGPQRVVVSQIACVRRIGRLTDV